jgi:hypothetical protein
MTLEIWNTLATFGTFVVIAATAIAALIQLRHARGSNQIAAMAELRDAQQTPQFIAADHFVRTELASKLKDPELRYQIANSDARTSENQAHFTKAYNVGDFYEGVGLLTRTGLVDRALALNAWASYAPGMWNRLAPFLALTRRRLGKGAWENFEYFVVLSQDWLARHPDGEYPAGVRRVDLNDEWLAADAQYAASRARA